MSLNLQNLEKDKTLNNPLKSFKRKTLKTYELTTPKSYKRKPSTICEFEPQKSFTAQRLQIYELETPKSWKSVSLKPRNLTGEKTPSNLWDTTSKPYKRQALTLCELECPKKCKRNTLNNYDYELKHSISYKRETLKINELETPKSYKRTRFKPTSLNPSKFNQRKNRKILSRNPDVSTHVCAWHGSSIEGVEIHPQKAKRGQQGSKGQNLSKSVFRKIKNDKVYRKCEGLPVYGGKSATAIQRSKAQPLYSGPKRNRYTAVSRRMKPWLPHGIAVWRGGPPQFRGGPSPGSQAHPARGPAPVTQIHTALTAGGAARRTKPASLGGGRPPNGGGVPSPRNFSER